MSANAIIHILIRTARGRAVSVTRLKIALALTFVYMIAEAVGGWLANSLALLADAAIC